MSGAVSALQPWAPAIAARSSGARARSLRDRVAMTRRAGSAGPSAARNPATSLSRESASTRAEGCSGCASHQARSAPAPSGLWAPSHHSRGSAGQRSKRPGHRAALRPLAIAVAGMRTPRPTSVSSAATAVPRLSAGAPGTPPRVSVPPGAAAGTTIGAPRSAAMRRITATARGSCAPFTTGTPGLMMPAFSSAIRSMVSPRISV